MCEPTIEEMESALRVTLRIIPYLLGKMRPAASAQERDETASKMVLKVAEEAGLVPELVKALDWMDARMDAELEAKEPK